MVFGGKLGPKIDQTCKIWVRSIWAKIQNFEGVFKHCVCLIGWLTLVKILARSNNICGSKSPKPQKGGISWMNQYESLRKTLKNFTFTTTNDILMELTTDIYLDKVFHLAKCWGVTHMKYESINKKTLWMSQKLNFLA